MGNKEDFIKKLGIKKENNFSLIGPYTNQRTRTFFRHEVCGYEWETQPATLLYSKGPEKGCPECQRLGNSILPENFPAIFYKKVGKGEFLLDESIPYKNQKSTIKIKHLKCGNDFTTYWGTFFGNMSCPICRKLNNYSRKKSQEQYEFEVKQLYDNEYSVLSVYESALSPITVRHNKCGSVFKIRASHLIGGHGCKKCQSSVGEILIRSFLLSNSISFEEQKTFDDCKDKKELPFDFCIISNTNQALGLIEYDGIQHYKPFKYFGGIKKFNSQVKHDEIKNQYTIDNNIPLLRIPYTMPKNEINTAILKFYSKLIK